MKFYLDYNETEQQLGVANDETKFNLCTILEECRAGEKYEEVEAKVRNKLFSIINIQEDELIVDNEPLFLKLRESEIILCNTDYKVTPCVRLVVTPLNC